MSPPGTDSRYTASGYADLGQEHAGGGRSTRRDTNERLRSPRIHTESPFGFFIDLVAARLRADSDSPRMLTR